jgi:hypothetical protein
MTSSYVKDGPGVVQSELTCKQIFYDLNGLLLIETLLQIGQAISHNF